MNFFSSYWIMHYFVESLFLRMHVYVGKAWAEIHSSVCTQLVYRECGKHQKLFS